MVTTSEINPTPVLAPYIRCYAYREFDTYGTDVIKPWHASHEVNIPFFFKAVPVKLVDTSTGKILKTGKNCGVVGLSSQYNGEMTFNGSYSFFQIIFKPNGFYKIFAIPSSQITDRIVWGEDIFNTEIKLLLEQLSEASTIKEMAGLANGWLLYHLNKQRWVYQQDRITATANLIIKKSGIVSIDDLSAYANMSVRNFERQFIKQVGMSPKQLCSITRFNNALELKLRKPWIEWTSIAHQTGYFDQMHLIKDFKRFCGDTPSILIKQTPILEESYISRVNA